MTCPDVVAEEDMHVSYKEEPRVSVLTPVYNGAAYLAECIESVLGQTYQNFEYIIVNNRSTDKTLAIAERYALVDKRIKIVTNEEFLPVIENHNNAFRRMSPDAKYCKVVSGDDLIFPACLTKMVELAEANPTVGVVGCYQVSERVVRWLGCPYPQQVFPGRLICRQNLLQDQESVKDKVLWDLVARRRCCTARILSANRMSFIRIRHHIRIPRMLRLSSGHRLWISYTRSSHTNALTRQRKPRLPKRSTDIHRLVSMT